MPNSFVFRRPFTKRGQAWLPPSKPPIPPLADVTGEGGVLVGGAATVLESVLVGTVTGAGGATVGGAATVGYGDHVGAITGAGGVKAGGTADVRFVHTGQVSSDIVVEWDLDNDGDFSADVEDVTPFVLSAETFTGRDWPSLLTGRAGPGKLRASLRNDDDRFNYFNTGSPLVTAPFSLRTGRKVRVRASTASSPDPDPLVKDRFRRAAGALSEDEFGSTYVEPLTDDFTISARRAVATSEGDPHMALIDTGSADYYVQAKISVVGTENNRVGIVYRYVDSDDYSLLLLDVGESSLQLLDVVEGVTSGVAAVGVEVYSGVSVGVLANGETVTGYLEGVPLISGTTINAAAESVGMYAEWATGDDRPELDEFFAWDGIPSQVEGVLWTGDLAELVSSVQAGPEKVAALSGEGWLSKLPAIEVTPPTSITGRKTGLLVGNVLAKSMLLHPPGVIDQGDVTTGVFAMQERSALAVARDVEETEFGFLYETQEGHVSFRARGHRDGAASRVTFTDATDGKYGYHRLQPYDWRKEVFNRVLVGISPWTEGAEAVLFTDPGPYILTPGESVNLSPTYNGLVARWAGHSRDVGLPDSPALQDVTATSGFPGPSTSVTVNMPASVSAGELLLIIVTMTGAATAPTVPTGFTENLSRIWSAPHERLVACAKVATGSEGGTTVQFTGLPSQSRAFVAHVYRVANPYGAGADSIQVGVVSSSGGSGSSGTGNPLPLAPTWGAEPTLYIACLVASAGADIDVWGAAPSGYSNYTTTSQDAADRYLATASRVAAVASEDPGSMSFSIDVGTGISVNRSVGTVTIGVRGGFASTTPIANTVPSGPEPAFTISYEASIGGSAQSHSNIQVSGVPLVQGDQSFAQVDDYESQDEHNAIRAYQNSASLFATSADAEAYAALVLSTYADDRPIVSMSFYASKSKAYRAQALRRRVGDRITLVANHNSGFGIERDFFIESIGHRWSHGVRLWETTWELSPA